MNGGSPGNLTTLTSCFLATVKHGGGSVMVSAVISWNYFGLIVVLHGRINSQDYLSILRDHVYPMVQALFPDGDIYQDDNSPIHSVHVVKNWCDKHGSDLEHMELPQQSLNLNII